MIVSNNTVQTIIGRIKAATNSYSVNAQLYFSNNGANNDWSVYTFTGPQGEGCKIHNFENFGKIVQWVEGLECKEPDELRLVEA